MVIFLVSVNSKSFFKKNIAFKEAQKAGAVIFFFSLFFLKQVVHVVKEITNGGDFF